MGVLQGNDNKLRSRALSSIHTCLDNGFGTPEFRTGLYAPVESILKDPGTDKLHLVTHIPAILIGLDETRAIQQLKSGQVLSVDNLLMSDAIDALNERAVDIHAEVLFQLLAELRNRDLVEKYPHRRSYGVILHALARTNHEDAEQTIRDAIEWNQESVSDEAARALCELKGVGGPAEFVLERLDTIEFEQLSQPQRHLIAACWLKWKVENGGFAQYFFNSSGDFGEEALAGLKAMKAIHTSSIVQRAFSAIGDGLPAKDREERQGQVADVFDEVEQTLDELNAEFYEDKDLLDVKIHLFAVTHAEHFRSNAEDASR